MTSLPTQAPRFAPKATPRESVSQTIEVLSSALDPIIAKRLERNLNGLPWTAVLTQLDTIKGRTPRQYATSDLQAQLRMLTERLGGIGYPFDDQTRRVSILGGELRFVRNQWAHNAELRWIDAWRAADCAQRLLSYFHCTDADSAELISRHAAFEYTGATQLQPVRSDERASDPSATSFASEAEPKQAVAPASSEEELIEPELEVLEREESEQATPLVGSGRAPFEPWTVILSDDSSVLDELPKKEPKMQVRALAAEITEVEGPIAIDRLARLIALSYGVSRLHQKRRNQIKRQIGQCADVTVDKAHFVWPRDIDSNSWSEFRPNSSNVDRDFTDISPIEICNAARFVQARHPDWDDEAVQRSVLQTFGRKRLTSGAQKHLDKAWSYL
ncbi:DUF3320 domain-containing protein [Pseudoclavibacter sp. CFCC 13611]|uniref:DUF3320 domain-containing protein n=1 Tax=Pseudoclavibacter sp. CFCC 13611 TaxID=2615178 RepID=UPI00130162FD|nr:DUF3320 domain-containing protein [Pseudoclavibacter sp. CFCC 13611]KAB1663240.1 DUF3320 domain-containing protein [Pseudoclavibacter sp. CFCC 13611]